MVTHVLEDFFHLDFKQRLENANAFLVLSTNSTKMSSFNILLPKNAIPLLTFFIFYFFDLLKKQTNKQIMDHPSEVLEVILKGELPPRALY